jgi:photoactive yellow protein
MKPNESTLAFEQANLLNSLAALDHQQLDELTFGVIGFGQDCLVKRYNRFETEAAGLNQNYVLGKHVFTQIAQCMNNYLVAQRYEDAWTTACSLDASLDYMLTWRMRPTKVKLRLLWSECSELAYVVLSPRTAVNK